MRRFFREIKPTIQKNAAPLLAGLAGAVVTPLNKTSQRCDIKSDRSCPETAVACFDRHVTKSRNFDFKIFFSTKLIKQRVLFVIYNNVMFKLNCHFVFIMWLYIYT